MTKKEERELIFNKYGGRCSYCGCKLEKGWHIDHLIPVQREYKWNLKKGSFVFNGNYHNQGANVIENKMPSCPSCNINKHSMSLEDFRKFISHFIISLNRDSTIYKIAKRYGLVKETNMIIVFYFENYNE